MKFITIVVILLSLNIVSFAGQLPTIVRDTVVGHHEIIPYYYNMGLVNKYGLQYVYYSKIVNNSKDTTVIHKIEHKDNVWVGLYHHSGARYYQNPRRIWRARPEPHRIMPAIIPPKDSVLIAVRIRTMALDENYIIPPDENPSQLLPELEVTKHISAGDILDEYIKFFVKGKKEPLKMKYRMEICEIFDEMHSNRDEVSFLSHDYGFYYYEVMNSTSPGSGSWKYMITNREQLELQVVSYYIGHGHVSLKFKNGGKLESFFKYTGVNSTKYLYFFEIDTKASKNIEVLDYQIKGGSRPMGYPIKTFVFKDENGNYHISTRTWY